MRERERRVWQRRAKRRQYTYIAPNEDHDPRPNISVLNVKLKYNARDAIQVTTTETYGSPTN
jgi:hypothetical protein